METQENVKFLFQAALAFSLVLSVITGIYIYLVYIAGGLFLLYTLFHGALRMNQIHVKEDVNEFRADVDSKSKDTMINNLQIVGNLMNQMNESERETAVQIAQKRAEIISKRIERDDEAQKHSHTHIEALVVANEQEKNDFVKGKCEELIAKVTTETAKSIEATKAKNEQKLAEMKAEMDKRRQLNAEKMRTAVNSTNSELMDARNRFRL